MNRSEKKPGHSHTRILVVDDEKLNRDLLKAFLADYNIVTADRGSKALQAVKRQRVDLILLDILMPGMNGIEVLKQLKTMKKVQDIPVIILTALKDRDLKIRGLEAGASDFLLKPVDKTELLTRIENLLKIKEFNDYLKDHNVILEKNVRQRTHQLEAAYKNLDKAHAKIKEAYINTILCLTRAAEHKDDLTASHIQRMSYYATLIADYLGLSSQDQEKLFYAAPMHDIGKIGIPDHILLKPGPLTKEEFEVIKKHPLIGAKILSGSGSPILKEAKIIALSHHERWDGSGYPKGLKGNNIPLSGRIVLLADVYDAMRSKRPYKKEFSHQKVISIITSENDRVNSKHFDPEILELFLKMNKKFDFIFQEYRHYDQNTLSKKKYFI
ncbi:MAG: response regulator [Spirochaetes bacterium]|nr:response regulator [Spirochaetota bacterium]